MTADPALTYQITSGSLAFTDGFTGALTRDAGEDVGTYAITQGTLALSSNYDLTFVGADLTITTRAVAVTADPQTKVYGDSDPALTYQITTGSLAFTDGFTGALTRDAGEDVGTYAITQGTLALSSNYDLTFVGADLTINQAELKLNAVANSKTYGNADPTFGYTLGGFKFSDTATTSGISGVGSCSRSNPLVEAAGTYSNVITCVPNTLTAPNYTFATGTSATFTINQAELKLNAVANSKTYGNADPTFGYTLGGFKFSDTATTSGSAASGAARAATRSLRQPGPIPTSSLACRTR